MNKPMKTPFYIIVVKTKDDRLYAEVDSTVGKKNAREMGRQSWDPELTAEEASALAARLKDFHIAD